MTIFDRLAAIVAAITLTCAPVTAQKISSLPAASTPAATDQALVIQGAGCVGSSGSCTTARMSLAQIGGYVARDPSITAAYQPADADLSAIAAVSTQPFGRARLADADAPTARSNLGLATVAATGLDTDLAGTGWTKVTVGAFGGGGTLSGASASVRYKQIGKTVFVRVRVDLGSAPDCGGCSSIRVALPITPVATDSGDQTILFGRESTQAGFGLQGIIPSGTPLIVIAKAADNTYPGGANYTLQLTGFYEAA